MWSLLAERTLNLARRITCSPSLRRQRYRGVAHVAGTDPKAVRLARSGVLVVQMKSGLATWLVMVCPCRCAAVLRVNLMKSINPHWTATSTDDGVTVAPSLDVSACGSHFWLRNSRVHWT